MQEKDEILKKLSMNKKSYERYLQNIKPIENGKIHDYLDNYLQK